MTLKDIESEALSLSAQDRALLAEHLLLSLDDATDVDCEQQWLHAAKTRYKDYKKDHSSTSSVDNSIQKARAKLK